MSHIHTCPYCEIEYECDFIECKNPRATRIPCIDCFSGGKVTTSDIANHIRRLFDEPLP